MLNKLKQFFADCGRRIAQFCLVAGCAVGAGLCVMGGIYMGAVAFVGLGALIVGLSLIGDALNETPEADVIEADVIEADVIEVDVIEPGAAEDLANAVTAAFATQAETSWEVDSAALLGADATSYLEEVLAAQVDQIVEAGQSRTTRKALGKYVRKQLRADLDDVVSALVRDYQVSRLDAEAIVLGPYQRILRDEIETSIQGRIAV